jgi:hypothetical protein
MRHLVGLVLALALLAALFFGAGGGVEKIIELRGPVTATGASHALTSPQGLVAVGAVAGTGLLLGLLLAVPQVSPLATGLPGLVLVGWSALVVLHSRYVLRYLPLASTHFAAGINYLLLNGVLALLGVTMLIPLAVPSRWRRRRLEADDEESDDIDVRAALGLIP